LAHGGGGRLTAALIADEIVPRFGDGPLRGLPDAADLPPIGGAIAFTTDAFVVQPPFFPGGDIGSLAVNGTVNDLAVCGARARWLSLALILEEGLTFDVLRRVLDSVTVAAKAAGVTVATGDTKVVPRGQCDGLYLATSGLGERLPGYALSPERIRPGDRVLVSGPVGDHGMAVMAARMQFASAGGPRSDCASVLPLVEAAAPMAGGIRWMRDPTRGGVAAALNECARGRPWGIMLHEAAIPLHSASAALADALGLDPLHSPCEGRIVAVCDPSVAGEVLRSWRSTEVGREAAEIGSIVCGAWDGAVAMETRMGGRRLVDMPLGELLPRIC